MESSFLGHAVGSSMLTFRSGSECEGNLIEGVLEEGSNILLVGHMPIACVHGPGDSYFAPGKHVDSFRRRANQLSLIRMNTIGC